MDLSIVIPAYEESAKIARDIKAATEFLLANELKGEIIVVDDGSQDDTAKAAREVAVPSSVGFIPRRKGRPCSGWPISCKYWA